MNFLKSLFSAVDAMPWVRPALGVVTAIAVMVKSATPSYTIAGHAADFYLTQLFPILAGASVGASAVKPSVAPKP